MEKYYFNEHSIFYAIKFVGLDKIDINSLKFNKYTEYKKMYLDFVSFIDAEVLRINKLINDYVIRNNNLKIYLFGAHIFSQFLINKGLQTNKIEAIIDNSPNKVGKRLYGSNLKVINPEYLKGCAGLVILKAGQYQAEVEMQLNQISKKLKIVS